jgi:hypothetical protein
MLLMASQAFSLTVVVARRGVRTNYRVQRWYTGEIVEKMYCTTAALSRMKKLSELQEALLVKLMALGLIRNSKAVSARDTGGAGSFEAHESLA